MAVEVKEGSRRGRQPGKKSSEKLDVRAKLERNRQSARECRARKKLRYEYLEELVTDREKAVFALRQKSWKSRACSNRHGLIRKYGLCFREYATDIGFKKLD